MADHAGRKSPFESCMAWDRLAAVGDAVTLRVSAKPPEIAEGHPMLGWTVDCVKTDEEGRIVQVFLHHEGPPYYSLCLSGWVTKDGLSVVTVRGAS